ncbi:uncharacterized protein LOC124259437 [Haliotis rubra]|uniref:uncharacterized protein LOC124259437 n=1 Tax=Haliotis rubra TaxID=36100 RepID=UPI001EE54D48|nr:uncharacterized protein LOC124259437 [Haliotis rubra]
MRVFLVLCILAVSRADLLHDILQREKDAASNSNQLEAIANSIQKRNFLDTLKNPYDKIDYAPIAPNFPPIYQTGLPVVEEIGKQVLPDPAKVAPSLISAGLTALIGRRDVDRRSFLDDLKKIAEGILKEVEVLAPKVIESALPGLLSGIGKREIERRNILDELKRMGEDIIKELKELCEKGPPICPYRESPSDILNGIDCE